MGGLIIYGATDPRPEIVTKIVTETVSVTDTFLVEIEGPKEIIENYYYLYNVKHNDSLYKISYKYYGDPMKWNIIAKANNINNPGIIWPYTTLKIPILK
jgi:nucleoid-associated protein YgaU|tara:strand:+ start:268 stop:564 length:297 start_codon:yes stop_codon:yes gene_type:complete